MAIGKGKTMLAEAINWLSVVGWLLIAYLVCGLVIALCAGAEDASRNPTGPWNRLFSLWMGKRWKNRR